MPNQMILISYFFMWYMLVILACIFVISGLDDFFIDIYFWIRYLWRRHKKYHLTPLTYEKLIAPKEQNIAILVPCWHEAGVIGTMLTHNCYSIDYTNYFFFVGVYPNDATTIAEVQSIANRIKQVQCVIGDKPGPTNKAANLNGIYRYIKHFEKSLGEPFGIFVLHDSEDIIHPLSFKLYNYLIPRKDMIQIPVFPIEVGYFNFTHWVYADEFAENHTKDIIVRESIKAHVPSAGVGTAFSKNALQLLVDKSNKNEPFAIDSLTEDYHTSLALRVHNLKLAFIKQSITRVRWQKRFFWGGGYVLKPFKEYIATREMFPVDYMKAVRQKSRWIIGIVFQEWDHNEWPNKWIIRYSLAHDRKSFITHFINGFGYFVFLFWLLYSLMIEFKPEYPSLYEKFNQNMWVWWLMVIVLILTIDRAIQRIIATYGIYGWIPALLSIPRSVYGNLINLHALMRAYHIYFTTEKPSKTSNVQPAWDKTEHEFPKRHVLVPFRKKLGELLIENALIDSAQLKMALLTKPQPGERLGEILLRLNLISKTELVQMLSIQYGLKLFPISHVMEAENKCRSMLRKKTNKWLSKHGIIPVMINIETHEMTLLIDDPTNEMLLKKIIRYFSHRKITFMLMDTA